MARAGSAQQRSVPDSGVQVRLHAYVQADGRFFPGGSAALGTSNFLLRRVRLNTEIAAARYFTLRVAPDFGQGKVVLFDAYLDFRPAAAFAIRAGKAKPPVGLERLQGATDIRFVERGLPTNLVPNRDVGIQLLGSAAKGALNYAVGVFNGVPDFMNGDVDATNDKDVNARLLVRFGKSGLGIAGTTGAEHGTVAAPGLATYVTPGQQPWFHYRDSTIANGRRWRLTPQAFLYGGSFGLLGEYVASSQVVSRGALGSRTITNESWQLAASWFVTGERASFTTVSPRYPFDPASRHWGAVEIMARYSALTIDAAAFPGFAALTTVPSEARAWAAGVAWHLAPAVKIAVNYEATHFSGGTTGGARAPEHFAVIRFQQAF